VFSSNGRRLIFQANNKDMYYEFNDAGLKSPPKEMEFAITRHELGSFVYLDAP